MAKSLLPSSDANTTLLHLQITKANNQPRSQHYYPQLYSSKFHLSLSLSSFSSKFHCHSNPCLSSHFNGYVISCLSSSSSSSSSTPSTSIKLYVSGLSFRSTEESLRNAFQQFGQLVEVNLVMDKIANRPRGFAFLRYATEEESKKAIEGMHGKFLDGRVIFVEVAKPRSEVQKNKQNNKTIRTLTSD